MTDLPRLYGDQVMFWTFIGIMLLFVVAALWGWLEGRRRPGRTQRAPQAASTAEAERLVQLRFERGEIDRLTYERELEEVRRRHVA